jgi:hypothetical protein
MPSPSACPSYDGQAERRGLPYPRVRLILGLWLIVQPQSKFVDEDFRQSIGER